MHKNIPNCSCLFFFWFIEQIKWDQYVQNSDLLCSRKKRGGIKVLNNCHVVISQWSMIDPAMHHSSYINLFVVYVKKKKKIPSKIVSSNEQGPLMIHSPVSCTHTCLCFSPGVCSWPESGSREKHKQACVKLTGAWKPAVNSFA